MSDDGPSTGVVFGVLSFVGTALVGLVILGMVGCPQYNVYVQRLHGEAELARAQQNRQIRVEEAKAKLDAAESEGLAEKKKMQLRAEGIKAIQEVLQGEQGSAYLRLRYIDMLEETGDKGRETIYIPTEAGIPILEARNKKEGE